MNLLMTMKSSGNLAAQNSMADPQQKEETSPGKLNPDALRDIDARVESCVEK